MKSLFIILTFLLMAISTITAQIPQNWAQHTVEDTINVPAEIYWDLFLKLDLEEIGSVGDYKDLPTIVKTTPVQGDFSKVGDSRRVHFNTNQTVLESIIEWEKPGSFAYELTEVELDLRKVAYKARGHFRYYPLPDGKTRVVWTYGFDQKNFLFKYFINRYIKSTHRFWMQDTLAAMKQETEKMYHASK